MEAKQYYKTFKAKDSIRELNVKLVELVKSYDPISVLEFGCGTGKNLELLDKNIIKIGIDVSSKNVLVAHNRCNLCICGDEDYLQYLSQVDVVFTCSVLDHIPNPLSIIQQFKRIARKAIVIAETTDIVGEYYFKHGYEFHGFTKVKNYSFRGRFGANYHLYFLNK